MALIEVTHSPWRSLTVRREGEPGSFTYSLEMTFEVSGPNFRATRQISVTGDSLPATVRTALNALATAMDARVPAPGS